MVQPFDPATTRDIERAIRESKLSLNPAAADRSIRVPIPELSEERRRDMVKLIKQLAEEAKVRLRAARKDGMDTAKKTQGRQPHHRRRPEGLRRGSSGSHQKIHQENRRTRRGQGSGPDEGVSRRRRSVDSQVVIPRAGGLRPACLRMLEAQSSRKSCKARQLLERSRSASCRLSSRHSAHPALLAWSRAAATKPANSGCGKFGLDWNSGWNCEPMKNG